MDTAVKPRYDKLKSIQVSSSAGNGSDEKLYRIAAAVEKTLHAWHPAA